MVRRGRDHFGFGEPDVARAVEVAESYRRRTRAVLPADAWLVCDLPADGVLVASPQLSGRRRRGRRGGGVRKAFLRTLDRAVRGRCFRHPAASDLGGNRG